jgi:hypothetical protein
LEKCWEQNIDIPHLFIDFQAASGTIWRKEKWSEMLKLFPPPPKLVIWSRILNNEIYAKVKSGKYLYSEFKVSKCLRKGYAIAPLLLNSVLNVAIRSTVDTQGNIFEKNVVK